jgi:hypothetical protein
MSACKVWSVQGSSIPVSADPRICRPRGAYAPRNSIFVAPKTEIMAMELEALCRHAPYGWMGFGLRVELDSNDFIPLMRPRIVWRAPIECYARLRTPLCGDSIAHAVVDPLVVEPLIFDDDWLVFVRTNRCRRAQHSPETTCDL